MKLLLALLLLAAPLAAQTRDSVVCRACVPVTVTRTDSVPRTVTVPITVWDRTQSSTTVLRDSVVKVDGTPPVEPPSGGVALVEDDFEDGSWYTKNCDQANASGGLAQEDGWCGTIYQEALRRAGTARCDNQGYQSKCAATTGNLQSGTTANMADISVTPVASDLYVRFYTKALPGYRYGAEKILSVNKGPAGVGGIYFGNLHINCGGGSTSTGNLQWQPAGPSPSGCRTVITMSAGRWYYIELHINPAARLLEVWADDCTNGCSGTPTKRLTLTNYPLASGTVGSLWFEAWSNPSTRGERLIDNVRASTSFNGFAK